MYENKTTETTATVNNNDKYPVIDYDTPEQIRACLNCEKFECDNCLRWVNGV